MNHKASLNQNKSVEPNSLQGMRRTATAIAVASVLSVATLPQATAGFSYGSGDTIAITGPVTAHNNDGSDLVNVNAYFADDISGSYGVLLRGDSGASSNTITNNGYDADVSGSAAAIEVGYIPGPDDVRAHNNTITNSGRMEGSGGRAVPTGRTGVAPRIVITPPGTYLQYEGTVHITAFAAENNTDADAEVDNNLIENSGTISGDGTLAVHLGSFAYVSGSSAHKGTAEVGNNSVNNSGGIVSDSTGVQFLSIAGGFSGTHAEATVNDNVVSNAYDGDINGGMLSGIDMTAIAATSSSCCGPQGNADASVEGNSNTNDGYAGDSLLSGASMNAIAASGYMPFARADAEVNSNEITNAENANIEGKYNGIALRAAGEDIKYAGDVAVNSNMISNDGTVFASEDQFADSAVKLASYGNLANMFSKDDGHGLPFANDTDVNSNTITNSSTGDMVNSAWMVRDSAVSLRADSSTGDRYDTPFSGSSSAEVNSNSIENHGFIGSFAQYNFGGGIELTADAGGDAYEYDYISSGGFIDHEERIGVSAGTADVNKNTVSNTSSDTIAVGGYVLFDADGIELNADASASAETYIDISGGFSDASGSADSLAFAGDADVNNNQVENSGSIEVTGYMGEDSQGIVLAADAWAYANSDVTAQSSGSSSADSFGMASGGTTFVNNNDVINSGDILTSGEDFPSQYMQGILLTSSASAFAYSEATAVSGGGNGDASGGATAMAGTAEVHNNNVVNSGTISTDGEDSSGIELSAFAWADADVDLSGSSTTDSDGTTASGGFASVANNTITNSGDITTAGGRGASSTGILLYADVSAWAERFSDDTDGSDVARAGIAEITGNSVDNSGVIDAWEGIVLEARASAFADNYARSGEAYLTDNTITNSGTIIADNVGIAIRGEASGSVINTIFTHGNSVDNSGSMEVYNGSGIIVGEEAPSGSGSYTWDNTINNTGTILAGEDTAIGIYGDAEYYGSGGSGSSGSNTLILGAPGFIAGDIILDGDANVDVTLTSGAGNSVAWTFDDSGSNGPSLPVMTDGPLPWFTDSNSGGSTWATIDPTAFAAAHNQVADLAGMASGMQFGSMGQDDSGMASGDPMTSMDDGGLWLAIEAGESDYDGDGVTTLDQETTLTGIAAGYSAKLNPETRVGAMLGYGKSELEVDSNIGIATVKSYESEQDGIFGGIYGRAKLGSIYLDLALNAGWQSHDQARLVNDNLQNDGTDFANASYDSFWFSPEIGVMLPIMVSDTLTVTPNLRARYVSQSIDGYTEKDSNSNATVDDIDIGVTELRGGLDVTHRTSVMALTGTIGYMSRSGSGDDSVNITMILDNNDVGFNYSDVDAAYGGISFAYKMNEATTLKLNASVTVGDDIDAASASASVNMKF
ncbi:outer membrane autotransporter barrel domain-containing protein [Solemya velum gill symbiont]|uniref:Outer membrane autotransporter barrel domain-containing protein n=1 Tax=Solemya velum gill symbiont TaxID=2340 RepID=A0A0B0H528_SOVGS|nr:autotransporter outer membrane beta-barrel domain-containing protein [Solemya velum gill symbiont]KHF24235.1 outer membrane autotransporter barrel domain-containing protein [Solemya velum gill symbiont]